MAATAMAKPMVSVTAVATIASDIILLSPVLARVTSRDTHTLITVYTKSRRKWRLLSCLAYKGAEGYWTESTPIA